ncbi:MAG TPA: class I SAM-dependent RNA methyltransferase [Nitrospiraceae bacterium]|nr:class I SAM-dependent RNA methyltransferase [Nitrospiraceae bacterium]
MTTNCSTSVTIEKLVQGGRGLARLGSDVLFVRGAIPLETVTIADVQRHKGFQDAMIGKVLTASPDRVTAPCPVYQICGGCQFQHLRYEAQLVQKREILQETLARVGKITMGAIPPVVASPNPYGYRSTIRFGVFRQEAGFALGFHEEHTHQPVGASGCLLVSEATREVIQAIQRRLAAQRRLPLRLDSLEVRRSAAYGSTLLSFHSGPAGRKQADDLFSLFRDVPDVVGQVLMSGKARHWQRWVEKQDWIADRLDDLIFRIGDRSFMQANWMLNETLAGTVVDWVSPAPGLRLLELYAGIGSLGLPLARRGALVTEVESNPYALADARHAAKANHIGRCRFRPLPAEAMLKTVQAGDYDLVLVDPPRTGVSEEVLQYLARLNVPRLLYLSCDAPTLARDLARLCRSGYRISRCQPFDMFPQTSHLEILVELQR